GLGGNDDIEFLRQNELSDTLKDTLGAPLVIHPVDLSYLISRSDDYVGVFNGGPGDDILVGSDCRDRLDGGDGRDVVYGYAGNDSLWGNSSKSGTTGFSDGEHDVLFGGQGNDDLIGGPGTNELYSWSQDPNTILTQLGFSEGQSAAGTASASAVLSGQEDA